jgi:plastocyanin domain-containing protein
MKSNILAVTLSFALIGGALAWTQYAPRVEAQASLPSAVTVDSNGIQHVTLIAKSGYHPKEITVRAGIPTKLTLLTDNTFDCSSSVTIPALTYKTQLPPTGTTTVALGTRTAGEEITGGCSMSMYGFKVTFE